MQKIFGYLLCFLTLLIPFDHRMDKWCRQFSLTLIPEGLSLPIWYEKRIYFYLSDLLSILLFLIALFAFRIPLKKIALEKSALCLILFFLLSFASILASPLHSYPIAYLRLIQLLTPILLFLSVSSSPKDWTHRVLICFSIGGVFQALLAIYQYFSQEPLGLYLLGELKLSHQAGQIPSPNGARWLFDYLFNTSLPVSDLRRASGTFNHSNPLGSYLLIALFSSFALFKIKPRLFLIAIPLIIFALLLTFSRSAFFAGILAISFYFYRLKPPVLLRWTVCLSFLFGGFLLSEQMVLRGGIVNYNEFSWASDSIRAEQNRVALQMMARHPLLGVGYQQFTYTPELNDFSGPEAITMVHNSLLLVGAESGIFALLALAGFFFFFLKRGRSANSEIGVIGVAVALAFCVIGSFDFYPILFQHAKMSLLLMLGLANLSTHEFRGVYAKL